MFKGQNTPTRVVDGKQRDSGRALTAKRKIYLKF